MPYGFKASKEGFDIDPKKNGSRRGNLPREEDFRKYMIWPLTIAYLRGARIQLIRYKKAASILEKNAVEGILVCLHEVSCLFEDLAIVSIYMKSLDETHKDRDLFITVRDHIRHDVRENLDKETEKRKVRRLEELCVKENLQIDVTFDLDCIKVGEIEITLDQIEKYLKWVDSVFDRILEEGKQRGYIKIDDNTKSKKKNP